MTTNTAPPEPPQTSLARVETDVQLRPLDVYRADCAVAWRQVRWVVAAGAVIIFVRVLLGGGLLLLGVVGVIGLFSFVILNSLFYLGARSRFRTSRVLGGPVHYSLTPSGLLICGSTFWRRLGWGNLHELLETRHLLILRVSSAQNHVIPKRCLSSGDLEKIRMLARPTASNESGLPESTPAMDVPLLATSFRLTSEDIYWGFVTLLLRKSYWYTGQLVFSFVLIFAVNPRFLTPLVFLTVGAGFFFYLAVHLYLASARVIRTNESYKSEIQYAFCESGVEAAGSNFSFHYDWGNFQSVIETSKAFLFCLSNAQMNVVPKRSFADISKLQALRQILKTHYHGKLSLKH